MQEGGVRQVGAKSERMEVKVKWSSWVHGTGSGGRRKKKVSVKSPDGAFVHTAGRYERLSALQAWAGYERCKAIGGD